MKYLEIGDSVIIPDPDETDLHNHSCRGIIVGFRGDYVQVMDQEGDVLEFEPERLTFETE